MSFVEAMDGIGEGLARAQRNYETARDRLVDGRGNLVRQADQLRSMGVPVRKALPPDLLDAAGGKLPSDTPEPSSQEKTAARLGSGD